MLNILLFLCLIVFCFDKHWWDFVYLEMYTRSIYKWDMFILIVELCHIVLKIEILCSSLILIIDIKDKDQYILREVLFICLSSAENRIIPG
jgi:hypothetical protein